MSPPLKGAARKKKAEPTEQEGKATQRCEMGNRIQTAAKERGKNMKSENRAQGFTAPAKRDSISN